MIALIDGDSMIFILGYVHREHHNVQEMYQSIDAFLENLFIQTGADMYYGAIAGSHKCNRYEIYKVKPYKGERPELNDYMQFWRPVVDQYLQEKWKFEPAHKGYEADDLIFGVHCDCVANGIEEMIVCSPDKDLRTIAGIHFDYQKNEFTTVDEHQARYNFFTLMLAGDEVDNIAGIPGYGRKKTKDKLWPLLEQKADRSFYESLVKELYFRHFGPYYGDIIYHETKNTVSLMWDQTKKVQIHNVPKEPHPFDTLSGD